MAVHLATLLDHYGTHGFVDSQATKLEFRTFNSVIASNPGLKQLTMRQLMSHVIKTPEINVIFPNLMKLATIVLLLAMSTVDCERGFSTLSRVKTNLRNCLPNRILNYLLTISMEGLPPSEFPYDDACDIWARMRNRRIQVTVYRLRHKKTSTVIITTHLQSIISHCQLDCINLLNKM